MSLREYLTFPTDDHRSQYPTASSVRIQDGDIRLTIEYVRDLVQVHRCSVVSVSGCVPAALIRSDRSRQRVIRTLRCYFIDATGLKPDYLSEAMQDVFSRTD